MPPSRSKYIIVYMYSTHTVQAFVYIVQYTHCSSICLHCTVHTLFKHLITLYSTHTVQAFVYIVYYLLTGSSGWKFLAPFTSPHVLLFWTLAGNSRSLEKWSTYLLLPPLKFTLRCKLLSPPSSVSISTATLFIPQIPRHKLFLLDLFVHIYHTTLEYYQAHIILCV